MVNDHLDDPLDPRQPLSAAIDTGFVGRPLIALHRKHPGEWLTNKDLAAQYSTKDKKKF